ncbi:MAG: sodium/proton-translocating pyrophosphatase, partial [Propionibacteriaceae bacterium]|nr:sodium/proton-translocating pyrophosphatase [Propionibacteriaceae bacterium]
MAVALGVATLTSCSSTPQSPGEAAGSGEANLKLPDLGSVDFLGLPGDILLGLGLIVCALGLAFGIATYRQLSSLPVHQSMREISELIYATCKTYLKQQGKFLLVLWAFIAAIIVLYYLFLEQIGIGRTAIVVLFSLIGM